ncbi:hypothetical protein Pmani_011928 [Petrolisthes manimaculis]|uniref:Uncharacterized protein n=1 Tax=Petrolisthes manimaculis TaxID=1843537 RepID=A0AAE1Q069_9EUCA|nr:hypothetical protein Pmani_011928 [Petrolisthes manimaculis]
MSSLCNTSPIACNIFTLQYISHNKQHFFFPLQHISQQAASIYVCTPLLPPPHLTYVHLFSHHLTSPMYTSSPTTSPHASAVGGSPLHTTRFLCIRSRLCNWWAVMRGGGVVER